MADATVDELAQAIADDLNAQSFSKPFNAECSDQPRVSRKNLTSVKLFVMPKGETTESVTRDRTQHTIQIDLGVYIPIDPSKLLAEMRPAKLFLEELRDLFRAKLYGFCGWTRTENSPLYDATMLKKHRIFFSVITLTFVVHRRL